MQSRSQLHILSSMTPVAFCGGRELPLETVALLRRELKLFIALLELRVEAALKVRLDRVANLLCPSREFE